MKAAGCIDYIDFETLKRTVSIETVLHHRGLDASFKQRGERSIGPCPIHGGDNPHAFVIHRAKNLWYCFTRCNRGGDVINLVRELDRCGCHAAGKYLATLTRIDSMATPLFSPFTAVSLSGFPGKPFQAYTKTLPLNPHCPFLQQKGIKPDTAVAFETGACHSQGFLANCIGIRLHDISGAPLGYAGRRHLPLEIQKYGKWKFPTGIPKKQLLFNFHRVRSQLSKGLVIVEGAWSVMRLAQLNIPAVALLGIHLSPYQYNLLCTVPRLILMLDGDAVGRKATQNFLQKLKSTTVDYVILPPNCDPDNLSDENLIAATRPFFA